jgi:uncharacterized metal-binding protein
MDMALECASCNRYACRVGRSDATPDDCPMRGPFPAFEELYATDEARSLLYHSARVEAAGYCHWTRVQEVVELATARTRSGRPASRLACSERKG